MFPQKKLRLKETIQNPLIEGIILKLKEIGGIDILDDLEDASSINADYYLNHSGSKLITNAYQYLIDKDDMTTDELLAFFATTAKIKFGNKWNRLYNAFDKSDYDPIENYNMEENENVASKNTSTSTGSSDVSGFNSSDYSPANKNETSITSEGEFDKNHRKLTRHGNIGVTTSQQMIESEFALREKNLYNILYKDLDSILCQEVY